MRLDDLIDLYQSLTPESLDRFGEFYAEHACFKDPFNEVRGLPAIRRIFSHMFAQVQEPRFVVTEKVSDGVTAFLVWTFNFRRGGKAESIRGVTRLRWDASGKVIDHRDYWDAAEELYMKLPLIGALMRVLRRVLAAQP
jgi:steroid Delta-isomerase